MSCGLVLVARALCQNELLRQSAAGVVLLPRRPLVIPLNLYPPPHHHNGAQKYGARPFLDPGSLNYLAHSSPLYW